MLKQGKDYHDIVKERINYYGVEESSPQDLLTFILGKRVKPEISQKIATLSTNELLSMSVKDFESIGMTKAMAEKIVAIIAFGHQLFKQSIPETNVIRSPEDASKVLNWLRYEQQEHFVVLFLNTKNQVISQKTIFKGSLNASIVHPREIFKYAIKYSSASIIVGHNHPSGNPSPSTEDIETTKRLVEAGNVIGIDVLDHIIIGDGTFFSLKEKGYI